MGQGDRGKVPIGNDEVGDRMPDQPAEVGAAFAKLCQTIARLRDPQNGCPWDLEQTHTTLRRYIIEEAYEAAELMDDVPNHPAAFCGELGDVLLQVILNAQLAKESGHFNIAAVIAAIDTKMVRRHPHVFGDQAAQSLSLTQIKENWKKIKDAERAEGSDQIRSDGLFKEADGVYPASRQALTIGKLAAKIAFDWTEPEAVFQQVQEEVAEVAQEFEQQPWDRCRLADEIGDVYFSLGQLCRHLGLDPEVVGLDANRKFLRRFSAMEGLAKDCGLDIDQLPNVKKEELWRQVKLKEQQT